MLSMHINPKYLLIGLIATPVALFAGYIAAAIVPLIVETVVPEVVRAVTGS
jgi:hypothetical protein